MDASSFPWLVTRAAGIAAYIILFFMVAMGELMASGALYRLITPPRAWLVHKYMGVSFGMALLVHMVSLLFDKFEPFNLADVLIPFQTDYRPFAVALGIIGFYLAAIILITSLISNLRHRNFWRKFHFLAYLLFTLGLFHGFFAGSDSGNIFMLFLYAVTGLIFMGLLFERFRLALSRR